MPFLLIVLFIVVPIAELYVIIQVGEAIGLWPTLGLLLADALLGSFLLKHQGRGAWRRFNEALAQRRFPGKEVVDGLLIVVGGTLLLAPGFITDIFGLILLVWPTPGPTIARLQRFTIGRFTVDGARRPEAVHDRAVHGRGDHSEPSPEAGTAARDSAVRLRHRRDGRRGA